MYVKRVSLLIFDRSHIVRKIVDQIFGLPPIHGISSVQTQLETKNTLPVIIFQPIFFRLCHPLVGDSERADGAPIVMGILPCLRCDWALLEP